MDTECAFCGAGTRLAVRVRCDDCRAEHDVCAPCAIEASAAGGRDLDPPPVTVLFTVPVGYTQPVLPT